ELVGEIHDENEEPEPGVQQLADDQFLVDGKVLLADLKSDLAMVLPPNGADTLGGWLLERLGAVPEVGTAIETDGYRVEVIEMDGQRLRKVRITRSVPLAAEPEPRAAA